MKKENLSDAFEMLDEDIIASVYKARTESVKKNPRRYLRYIAIAACFCIIITSVFVGVMNRNIVHAQDLMEGIAPNQIEKSDLDALNESVTDFAVRLLKATHKDGENTLVSPLSVLCALSMTANGANGETRAQMESVLGMSVEELNEYLYSYISSRPESEKYKLSIANSIWFKDDGKFVPNRDFLQTNADYYRADIYKAPFDDSTLDDINNWVERKTEGMIEEILDNIPEEAIMYLVNALAFEAEWEEIYYEGRIQDRKFILEDGTKKSVKMMYSNESDYFETEDSIGFLKYYKDRKYAFAAILPDEGISIYDYVDSLNGEKINGMLTNIKRGNVCAGMPKFQTEYSDELSKSLIAMGMTDAFDAESADFGKLGTVSDRNIFIGRVLHKTFISVDEKGTKAGAATVVEMLNGTMMEKFIEINLDRPFVYMLIDLETNTPFFIGTMMNPEI